MKVHERLQVLERVHELYLQNPVSGSHHFTVTDLLAVEATLGVRQFDCPEVTMSG